MQWGFIMDVQNRIFGYQNMLIYDGWLLSASLGLNPSLTITVITKHAMSYIFTKTIN